MQAPIAPGLRGGAPTLSDQIYDVLLEAIVEQRFRPGERLVLDDLALQLNVSRTPVRDALSRLATQGLVRPKGRRGYCVATLTEEGLMQLFDVRLMCETYAAENGVPSATPAVLERLASLAAQCAQLRGSPKPSDRVAAALLDKEFHRLIVGLQGNPSLAEIYDHLSSHLHGVRLGLDTLAVAERRAKDQDEHQAIITALRQGDATAAKEAVRSHIINVRDNALAALRRGTDRRFAGALVGR